jgi:hypothetical protein
VRLPNRNSHYQGQEISMNGITAGDFCPDCKSKSDDISAGHVVSLNFAGRAFIGASNPCPHCGSTERNLFFFMLVPIVPLGTWKVKQIAPGRILTRKLATGSIADFDTHAVRTQEQQRRWHKQLIIGFVVFVIAVNILIRIFK